MCSVVNEGGACRFEKLFIYQHQPSTNSALHLSFPSFPPHHPPSPFRLRAGGDGVPKKYPVIAKLVDGSIAGRQFAMEVGDWIIKVNGQRFVLWAVFFSCSCIYSKDVCVCVCVCYMFIAALNETT